MACKMHQDIKYFNRTLFLRAIINNFALVIATLQRTCEGSGIASIPMQLRCAVRRALWCITLWCILLCKES